MADTAPLSFGLTGRSGTAIRSVYRMFEVVAWFLVLAALAFPADRRWAIAPFAAFAVAITWMFEMRWLRIRVCASTEALTVRNRWRTYTIAWEQVDGFDSRRSVPLKTVRLVGGKQIRLEGIAAGMFGDRTPQDAAIEQLERYRAAISADGHIEDDCG